MQIKPQKHLINILMSTKNHHPNFTLFLGAGASITSGVKSAGGMIKDWREAYCDMHSQEALTEEGWYDKDNEYSELFEKLYDQPTQRREYIETCITSANPSWGYVYLVNLLKEKHFNTIFTTNFDDLINEACYTFSDNLRPVVCAHDSSINSVRLTSSRPKIIKLHGDFLFDNIKNTIRELESLEDNMRSKFRQFANEFGMIVMGYSGHDRSIMDTLNTLLHSSTCFPHGIYWCTRDKFDDLPEGVKNLARFPRFHLIEITGFDEFMAELHNAIGCTLQEEVVNPYSALSKKLDKYFSSLEDTDNDELSNHKIINRDMNNLADHVRRVNSVSQFVKKIKTLLSTRNTNVDDGSITESLEVMLKETRFAGEKGNIHFYNTPNFLIANSAFRSGDYDECMEFCQKHISNGPSIDALILICRCIIKKENHDELPEYIEKITEQKNIKDIQVVKAVSMMVELLSIKRYSDANSILNYIDAVSTKHSDIILINKALINKLKGDILEDDQRDELCLLLEHSIDNDETWIAFGAALLLEKDEVAAKVAEQLDEGSLISALTKEMPIFTLISADLYEKVSVIALSKGIEVSSYSGGAEDTNVDDVEGSTKTAAANHEGVEQVKSAIIELPSEIVASRAINDNDAHTENVVLEEQEATKNHEKKPA